MSGHFGIIPVDVLSDKGLTGFDLRVYGIVSAHANAKTRLAYCAAERIATFLCAKIPNVRRSLKNLREAGHIKFHAHGKHGVNVWLVPVEGIICDTPKGVGGIICDTQGVSYVIPKHNNEHIVVGVGAQSDLNENHILILDALGVPEEQRNLWNVKAVEKWLQSGADLHKHIIPTILNVVEGGNRPSNPTLHYFTKAIEKVLNNENKPKRSPKRKPGNPSDTKKRRGSLRDAALRRMDNGVSSAGDD